MPTFAFSPQAPGAVEADALAVFATRGEDGPVLGADAIAVGETLEIDLAGWLAGVAFDGELGAVARVPTRSRASAPVLLVVGLGAPDDVTLDTLRKAAGAAARNATKNSILAIVVPGDTPVGEDAAAAAQAATEGAALGAYAYTRYRSKKADTPSLEAIRILTGSGLDGGAVEAGVTAGAIVAGGVILARDLVNTPPFAKRPPALADRIAEIAAECGLGIRVLDERALAEGGFGGILGVGQGSSEPPRLVELTYEPSAASGHVALVGKGITFDSGGLSLKPTSGMTTMKSDMSGAAAVVGAMSVLGSLGVATKVTGLVALAENMPSGAAIRVSDVLTHYNGTTVEVMNTDAEGRLVLADALAYAAEREPDAIIDLATLTGAQIVALGSKIAGLMGTDDDLLRALQEAAAATGEKVWHLPLPQEYAEHLKSEVADLKNVGKGREAGTVVAGLFLKEFTGGRPWAHLDIAGPAFSEEGDAFTTAKGATGAGVRMLARYLQRRG
ncbi:MAG TPA: leucyl aminopeptidase [Egibacteraceae bacterium]|nr:leucyl aminopeptidase [Egibacteraceae bacterium]